MTLRIYLFGIYVVSAWSRYSRWQESKSRWIPKGCGLNFIQSRLRFFASKASPRNRSRFAGLNRDLGWKDVVPGVVTGFHVELQYNWALIEDTSWNESISRRYRRSADLIASAVRILDVRSSQSFRGFIWLHNWADKWRIVRTVSRNVNVFESLKKVAHFMLPKTKYANRKSQAKCSRLKCT